MEVNSVVTPESQPTKIKVTSSSRIIFEAVDVSNGAKGFVLVQIFPPS
jgi:hypothetical protein